MGAPKEDSLPTDRSFALTFAGVFAVMSGMAWWRATWHGRMWGVFLAVAAVFLALAFTTPQILRPLNRIWMAFAGLLHRIFSPIMLGVIFFVVVTPVALFFKLTGRDELRRSWDRASRTYWISREPPGPDGPSSFPRQF